MNPSLFGDFGNKILGILDVLAENWNQRGVLLREELFRHRTAFLAHTHLLGVKQKTLHIARWASTRHVGHAKEGTGLWTDLAAIVLKGDLIA